MKKALKALWNYAPILSVVTALGVIGIAAASPPDGIIDAKQSPIVQLSNGCSGFYIGAGRFVTAGHCTQTTGITLTRDDDVTAPVTRAITSPPGITGGMDFAILWVDDDKFTSPLEVAPLACDGTIAGVGSAIKVVGYPAGIGKLTTWGKIAAEPFATKKAGVPWKRPAYWLDVTATGGSSGSIVSHAHVKWSAIAILVGGMPGTSYVIAVPISEVCEALDIRS